MEFKEHRLLSAVALSTVLIIGGCATKGANHDPQANTAPIGTTTPESLPIDPVDEAYRHKAVAEWLTDVKKVVDVTHDDQAQRVYDLLENAGLETPKNDLGLQVLERPKTNTAPFIAVLTEKDAALGPKTASIVNNPSAAAFYNPDINTVMLLEPAQISPTWRAIITLHEGNHALEYTSNPYDWQDGQTFVQHELSTHEFENRIISELGGEEYVKFLNSYAEELAGQIVGSPGHYTLPRRGDYRVELDTIFGPALSKNEKDLRQTHVWIAAAFLAFDKKFGAQAENEKSNLLGTLYAQSGVLPQG